MTSLPLAAGSPVTHNYISIRAFWRIHLYFLGDVVAFDTAGAEFKGYGGAADFGFDFLDVWFPDPAGTVFGVADRVSGGGVFSAKIAGP